MDYLIIENKKLIDYVTLGIPESKILRVNEPCFTWNKEEQKILYFPNTYEIRNGTFQPKKDNIIVFLKSYTEIPTDEILSMKNSEKIFILEEHQSISKTFGKSVYRFARS